MKHFSSLSQLKDARSLYLMDFTWELMGERLVVLLFRDKFNSKYYQVL